MDAEVSPLEEIRRKLALPLGENAVFDGWAEAAVNSAADSQGVDPAQARLAISKDQAGKIDLYIRGVDRALEEWFTPERLEGLKIREKIRAIVWKRLEIMRIKPIEGTQPEAVRDAVPLLLASRQIDPFAVANLIEWKAVCEIVAHPNLPSESRSMLASLNCRHIRRSSLSLYVTAFGLAGSSRYMQKVRFRTKRRMTMMTMTMMEPQA